MGLLFLITAFLLIDLGIKDTIERTEDDKFPVEIEETGGMVVLHKNHNPGFPFGFLEKYPKLVTQLPLVVVSMTAGAFLWMAGKKGHKTEKLGLAMVLSGGLSNLYDRLVRGYVVDYFSIRWKSLKKVVFNLGDILIFAGTALVFLSQVAEMIGDFRRK